MTFIEYLASAGVGAAVGCLIVAAWSLRRDEQRAELRASREREKQLHTLLSAAEAEVAKRPRLHPSFPPPTTKGIK